MALNRQQRPYHSCGAQAAAAKLSLRISLSEGHAVPDAAIRRGRRMASTGDVRRHTSVRSSFSEAPMWMQLWNPYSLQGMSPAEP